MNAFKNLLNNLSLVLVICGLVLVYGCERDPKIQDMVTWTGPIDPEIVAANTQFGFNLFTEIHQNDQNNNIFISPFSVSVALAMTLNGAAGETEQAMTNTLQLHNMDSEAINSGYAQLQHTLQTSDPKVTLNIANSLWTRQDFTLNTDFKERNTLFFDAEISTLDFSDTNSVNIINQWVSNKTEGNIPDILNEISPDEVLFLINAIYFKGKWQTEFDPSKTRDSTFHLSTEINKQVSMMVREDEYPFYYGEDFQALSLPYGDGQIGMYIFLPSPNSDLNTFLESLNIENWENWMTQFRKQKVWVQLPKLKLEYKTGLNDILKSLGMEIAFNSEQADFTRMTPSGLPLTGNLYISKVDHKAIIDVNEEGTEAAAVTSIGISVTSLPPQFIVDRPFFFAIYDNETKTVLFMGTVVDPSNE